MSIASVLLDKPRYLSVTRHDEAARDKKGKVVVCERCEEEGAVWTGMRRPRARIMPSPYAFCGECWRHRME